MITSETANAYATILLRYFLDITDHEYLTVTVRAEREVPKGIDARRV